MPHTLRILKLHGQVVLLNFVAILRFAKVTKMLRTLRILKLSKRPGFLL